MARLAWKGFYYDGKTAFRHDADVTISPDGIRITGRFGSISWRYDEVTQTQGRHRGEPARIEKGDEALIVSEDGFIKSVKELAPPYSSRFSGPSKAGKRVLFIVIAFLLVIPAGAGAYLWAIPRASKMAADRVPPWVEERLGRTFVRGMLNTAPLCKSPEINAPVQAIEERLAAAAPRNPYRFHVFVLKSEIINAFAAPGGYIVVFTGLIKETKSPEELAGVLAHETEHVLQRHATREIFENYSAEMLISLFLGDFHGASGAANVAASLRYSRLTEDEADRLGAGLLMKAGIDPRGMVDFFAKLPDAPNVEFVKYLSTHPATADRVVAIKRVIAGKRKDYAPLLPGIDWKKVRASCD